MTGDAYEPTLGEVARSVNRVEREMQAGFAARSDIHRAVADYIAGMTDRYALREHERLTGRKLLDTSA